MSCFAELGMFFGIRISAWAEGIVEYFLAFPEENVKKGGYLEGKVKLKDCLRRWGLILYGEIKTVLHGLGLTFVLD
jgi:hypothetical protein